MSELKPCPFCGKEIELFPSHFEGQWCVHPPVIHCTACHQDYEGVGIAICDAMSDAKKEDFADNLLCNWWNRRPAEDALKAENEKLCSTISGMEKTIGRAEKVLGERNLLAAEVERIKSKLALVKKHIVDNRDALLFVMKSESSRANYCEYAFCESLIELINAPDTGKMEG